MLVGNSKLRYLFETLLWLIMVLSTVSGNCFEMLSKQKNVSKESIQLSKENLSFILKL